MPLYQLAAFNVRRVKLQGPRTCISAIVPRSALSKTVLVPAITFIFLTYNFPPSMTPMSCLKSAERIGGRIN
jgi:hypothetical protein